MLASAFLCSGSGLRELHEQTGGFVPRRWRHGVVLERRTDKTLTFASSSWTFIPFISNVLLLQCCVAITTINNRIKHSETQRRAKTHRLPVWGAHGELKACMNTRTSWQNWGWGGGGGGGMGQQSEKRTSVSVVCGEEKRQATAALDVHQSEYQQYWEVKRCSQW